MRRFAARTLAKNGNSFTVSIPREFCAALALYKGITLNVIFDDETKVLVIEKPPRRSDDLVEISPARAVRSMLV